MASDDTAPQPPTSDDGDEKAPSTPQSQDPNGHPDPDVGATSPGWTTLAAPGKPDGEVDTRAR